MEQFSLRAIRGLIQRKSVTQVPLQWITNMTNLFRILPPKKPCGNDTVYPTIILYLALDLQCCFYHVYWLTLSDPGWLLSVGIFFQTQSKIVVNPFTPFESAVIKETSQFCLWKWPLQVEMTHWSKVLRKRLAREWKKKKKAHAGERVAYCLGNKTSMQQKLKNLRMVYWGWGIPKLMAYWQYPWGFSEDFLPVFLSIWLPSLSIQS